MTVIINYLINSVLMLFIISQLFSQPEIQERAARLTVELLQSFAGTLEQLALLGNTEKPTDRWVVMMVGIMVEMMFRMVVGGWLRWWLGWCLGWRLRWWLGDGWDDGRDDGWDDGRDDGCDDGRDYGRDVLIATVMLVLKWLCLCPSI